MDAIHFLKNEHKKVRLKFKVIAKKTRPYETRRKMFDKLCRELVIHETMEHKTWYPYFKKELKNVVKPLLNEEKSAAKAIKELKKLKTQEKWENKFVKFKKAVEKHAGQEEKKLFPKVKKLLDPASLKIIEKKMRAFKKAKSRNH